MNVVLRQVLTVLAFVALALPASADSFRGVVTYVTDGDTLWVRPATGGPAWQIRLEGIDAPEICQAFGPQARAALATRVLHRPVQVTLRAQDSYQRWLGHVTADGEDMAQFLVRKGYAWSYRFKGDRGRYASLEARARQSRLGLWRDDDVMPPRKFRQTHGSCHPT
jgi:micrococcal nuclease